MAAINEIEKLVNKIAKAALADDISLTERVDALKVLTPYYVALKKDRTLDEDGETTMVDLAQAMQEPTNAQVRSHRGG